VVPVFSSTKAVAALMMARLVGEGRLDYGQTVASVWPAFAQAGKGAITVEQALSHQAGLAGLRGPFDPAEWFDWDALCARLAAAEPLWPPGTASGYHPITFGYLAGEIFRRIDGRTLGTALREDVCEPLGLDFWIGLPEAQDHRLAQMQRPSAMPNLGELTEARQLAFLKPWSSPAGRDQPRWRRAEIPSATGHGTALALARLHAITACDGRLDGRQILPAGMAAQMSRARISGPDRILPFTLSWGAGVLRNTGLDIYGPNEGAFGHSGWGGSCGFADPARRLSAAYVMNRQSPHLIGDPRAMRLIGALYGGL
jgi:CubicO group peptidase (beta-lactamase class C family)